MKKFFWMLMTLPMLAFAGVSCEKTPIEDDGPTDGDKTEDFVFPTYREAVVKAGESYTLSVNCPTAHTISIPNVQNFYIEDPDGQARQSVAMDAGSHSVKIFARETAIDYDNDLECEVSLTVGSRTEKILKLTVAHLTREFKLYAGTFDHDNGWWDIEGYKEIPQGEALNFVFNPTNNRYELPIRVECDFDWGFNTAIDWIEQSSLTDATVNANSRTLLLDTSKLKIDGMNGEITFTAVVNTSSVVPVATYPVNVPASNEICYAYFGSTYIGISTELSFDAAGNYRDPNAVDPVENISGTIVGTSNARIIAAGLSADGETYQINPDYMIVTYGESSDPSPLQIRKFTFDMAANHEYNRTGALLVFNGEAPADLIDGAGINSKYAKNIIASVNQSGEFGRADGSILNIVDTELWGFEINERVALEYGLKFDILDGGEVVDAIRSTLGIPDLEVWRLTYKSDIFVSEFGPMPLGWYASFYFTGYEDVDLDWNIDEATILKINSALGWTAPLHTESGQNDSTAPKSNYIVISPLTDTAREECVMIAYSFEGGGNGTPLAAFHVVFDPKADF